MGWRKVLVMKNKSMECVIKIGHWTIHISVNFEVVAEFNLKGKEQTLFNLVIHCHLLSFNMGLDLRQNRSQNHSVRKQDRPWMCNVTSRSVRVTVVAVVKHWVLRILIVCLCPFRLTHIFPNYLTNGTIFEKNWQNVCFGFLCNIYLKHYSF
jgi:hypothetical protein